MFWLFNLCVVLLSLTRRSSGTRSTHACSKGARKAGRGNGSDGKDATKASGGKCATEACGGNGSSKGPGGRGPGGKGPGGKGPGGKGPGGNGPGGKGPGGRGRGSTTGSDSKEGGTLPCGRLGVLCQRCLGITALVWST